MSAKNTLVNSCIGSVAKEGLDGIATARIAKNAGVATGTLFHHFPDKRALLGYAYLSVTSSLSKELLNSLQSNKHYRAAHLWNSLMKFWVLNPDSASFLSQMRVSNYYSREIRDIEEGMLTGLYSLFDNSLGGVNPKLQLDLVLNMSLQLAEHLRETKPNEKMTGEVIAFGFSFLKPILADSLSL